MSKLSKAQQKALLDATIYTNASEEINAAEHNNMLTQFIDSSMNESEPIIQVDFNANNKKIINLADPTNQTDAVNKKYIDDRLYATFSYVDVAEMLSRQFEQLATNLCRCADATTDPNVDEGSAYYEYLGVATADLADYYLVSAPENHKVDSVNGKVGDVVLDPDDLDDTATTNKFTSQADKDRLADTSGTNTGDQDLSGLALKSNVLELDNTDVFVPDADYEPATKKYVDDNGGGGGGIPEAPIDTFPYARKDAGWVHSNQPGVKTWLVNPAASGGNGSSQEPFTVAEAIAAATAGDIIMFQSGTYTTDIETNKTLHFVGQSLDACTINVTNFFINSNSGTVDAHLDNLDITATNYTKGTGVARTYLNSAWLYSPNAVTFFGLFGYNNSWVGSGVSLASGLVILENSEIQSTDLNFTGTGKYRNSLITGNINAATRQQIFTTCTVKGDVNCAVLEYNNTVITGLKVGTTSTTINNQSGAVPYVSIGAFTGPMVFNQSGSYDRLTMTGDILLTASSVVANNFQAVRIEANGINSITFGAGIDKVITAFTNPLPAGGYWFYMASPMIGEGVHVNVPDVASAITAPPTITSMTVETGAENTLVVTFDAQVSGTIAGYTFRVDATPRALSSVSGSGIRSFVISGAPIAQGQSLDLAYDSGTGDTVDILLEELVTFAATPDNVTNNVSAVTQLTALTLGTVNAGNGQATIQFTNPNSSNEDSNDFEYKLDTEPTTWTAGVSAVTGSTQAIQTGLTNALLYNFRATAKGTGLYSDSPLSNVVNGTPSSWSPADLAPNLTLWLDASVGVTEAGTGVSVWADQSTNGRDFVQGTDANRPTYNTDEILFTFANTDSLEIVGSTTDAWITDFHDGTLGTYEICIKAYNNQAGNSGMIGNNGGSVGAAGFHFYFRDGAGDLTVTHRVGRSSPDAPLVSNVADAGSYAQGTTYEWFRVTGKLNEILAADKSVLYNESTVYQNNTDNLTATVGNATFDLQIGTLGNNVAPMEGGIKEIIIVDRALTAQEWIDIKAR